MEEAFESGFDYSIDREGLLQGAEARIYPCLYLGKPAVLKERFSKKYRHETLDSRLNKLRMRNELKGIVKAQQLGVDAPAVYFVDNDECRIILERVEGQTARDWIEELRETSEKDGTIDQYNSSTEQFGLIIGEKIAKLHCGNLIHGDLTTSNIILRNKDLERPAFIDFGLAMQGKISAEEKGVDLYVLERAVASTHCQSTSLIRGIIEGYRNGNGKQGEAVLKKLEEIRLRGRKRDMIG